MRLLPAHPSWALLLLAAAALVGGAAAYPATCGDMQTPTAGNDQTPGLALSGPALVAPSAAGYAFAVNPTSDALEFYVQSAPGVGNTGKSAFTRKLGIALSGAGAASYSAATAGAPGTCYRLWDRFTLAAPATNVSALAGPLLTAAEATGAADTCYFNHHFSIPWATFRADGNCGLNLANNGSANTFSGRLHVWWEDYDSMSAQTPIRTAATVWYPVTISVASDATSTTGNVNNVEEPYNNDFEITELTYSNIGTSVHVTMKYQLSTKWPYYPYLPANDADKLVNTAGTYGLLPLGSWPSKTWTSTIDPANDGTNCAAVGDTCTLKGELKYSWEPTAPGSCTIAGTYQLDLTLGCSSSGGNLQNCGAAMRSALALPTLGQVVVPETILNLCAVESAPSSAAPPVGGAIGFTSNMNFLSAVSKIDYVSYRVARADLSSSDAQVPAYWELWDAANLKPSTLGTTVKLSAEAIDVSSTSWDLISSFTPNTLVRETALGSVDFVNPSRAAYMIVLPDDHGASFEFSVQVVIRVYTAGARRMLYRDITRIEKRQAGGSEITFESGPLSMEVPSSIPCESHKRFVCPLDTF